MKQIIIGDIHGRDSWKAIVAKESDADEVIFIGDYFDSWDESSAIQMYNFKEIIEYKETTSQKVIMLIGNHDFHYFPEIGMCGTSGYQAGAAPAISQLIDENRKHLQICYKSGNFLFTHAGVSETFLEKAKSWSQGDASEIDDILNDLFKAKTYAFDFCGRDNTGDDITQTPIWIRPRSLMKDSKNLKKQGIIQIVGHTQQNQIDAKGKATGEKYFFIDTLGTSGEYLEIIDGQINVKKI